MTSLSQLHVLTCSWTQPSLVFWLCFATSGARPVLTCQVEHLQACPPAAQCPRDIQRCLCCADTTILLHSICFTHITIYTYMYAHIIIHHIRSSICILKPSRSSAQTAASASPLEHPTAAQNGSVCSNMHSLTIRSCRRYSLVVVHSRFWFFKVAFPCWKRYNKGSNHT